MKNSANKIVLGFFATSLTLLIGCSSTVKQESAGQYLDSTAITTKVKADLLADPQIKSAPITVNTYKDKVQLSGFVVSNAQAKRAAQIAAATPGVKSVQNDLVVR